MRRHLEGWSLGGDAYFGHDLLGCRVGGDCGRYSIGSGVHSRGGYSGGGYSGGIHSGGIHSRGGYSGGRRVYDGDRRLHGDARRHTLRLSRSR